MTHFYDATFDTERESGQSSKDKFRSEFRRDFARLVHSPAFRRLQDKTQLIPGVQSDFYRNRLTHSMEVAQVAKSIAQKLNSDLEKNNRPKIDLDLVEFAGLAHDLGHPPFGHTGEAVLNEKMSMYGGFEGNAQTLRILARLEKKEDHYAGRQNNVQRIRRRSRPSTRSRSNISLARFNY